MHADQRAMADRGHRLRLGEDFGVGPDAHFEVLRPGALLDQDLLDPRRLGRARAHTRQVVAEDPLQPGAYRVGAARVTARLLFDHALQGARDKRDAGRLDRLQVARREQARRTGVEIAAAVGQKRVDRADRGSGRGADRRCQIVAFEPCAGRRRDSPTDR